ncbi:MAG TPA: ATP-binding protein [Verrucomicrobiae bacterium]|nr:ATP-binding protein [Verrucomicrobiae bacterium]
MKSFVSLATQKLSRCHPVALTLSTVLYELGLGTVDFTTPEEMSFTIFYLLGVVFAAWSVGPRAAMLVSALSAGLMAFHEGAAYYQATFGYGIVLWNASTRLLLFCVTGWLTAEITRLNRLLQSLVTSRTAQLQAETEKHRATSAQLEDALGRLRAIIAGAPIIISAVDRNGVIAFEDGRALSSLGVKPGEHVGQNVLKAYPNSRQFAEHVRKALDGEEFSSHVEIGSVELETWYTPSLHADGSKAGYTVVAVNVTEQRRLERQILEISDREQARIGQEIHDGLCQQLVSLAFDANALESELEALKLAQARTANRIAHFLDQSITEARQLARGLFPIRLEAQGLPSALEELARSTRDRFKVECKFESGQSTLLESKAMATHLYRIAQEAVVNAVKHASPGRIAIKLNVSPERIVLEVQDDGRGMASTRLKDSRGMGLHIMAYRARSIGGTFVAAPASPGGTLISCCVPRRVH